VTKTPVDAAFKVFVTAPNGTTVKLRIWNAAGGKYTDYTAKVVNGVATFTLTEKVAGTYYMEAFNASTGAKIGSRTSVVVTDGKLASTGPKAGAAPTGTESARLASTGRESGLPLTGAEVGTIGIVAFALMGAGAVILLLRRRQTS
jgi:LPXTG-motif cell wall-anchored protein